MASIGTLSMRVNGKNWHENKKPFRTLINKGDKDTRREKSSKQSPSYSSREKERVALAVTKAREAEMKAEKQEARDEVIRKSKDKRAKKAERERWEKLQEKLHKKVIERRKRRERRRSALEGKKVNRT